MFLFIYLISISIHFSTCYNVPNAQFKIFRRGFEVSIPASRNVKLFAFHGKINEAMNGWEAGDFSIDITRPTEGRFVYENKNAELEVSFSF